MNINIDTSKLSDNDRKFMIEMLPYISTNIDEIKVDGNNVYAVADEEFKDEVLEKVKQLEDMIIGGKLNNKEAAIKNIYDKTSVSPANQESVFRTLLDNGALIKISDGVYAYSGIVLKLMRYFNEKIADYGKETFKDVTEQEYPVLYPVDKYSKGRYFESFPHYIMFSTVLNNDLDTLNRFANNGINDERIFDEIKKPKNLLRHAACAPLYEIISDSVINEESPKTYMVIGKCFRNEADNVYELARLNEFTMKEFVFVGTPQQCNENIAKAKELWYFFADTFKLKCKIDTANDSFFASNYKKLKLFQILGDSKQEFKWNIPYNDNYIACSSANFHRTHFSKPYNIKSNKGSFCHTACFAFGIERMVYAFLNQKGCNPAKWDKQTYDEISSYIDL